MIIPALSNRRISKHKAKLNRNQEKYTLSMFIVIEHFTQDREDRRSTHDIVLVEHLTEEAEHRGVPMPSSGPGTDQPRLFPNIREPAHVRKRGIEIGIKIADSISETLST